MLKPIGIIVIGVATIVGGFLFDVIFINIPPQDPPDWLIKERIKLIETTNLIYYTGFGILAIGIIYAIARKIKNNVS